MLEFGIGLRFSGLSDFMAICGRVGYLRRMAAVSMGFAANEIPDRKSAHLSALML